MPKREQKQNAERNTDKGSKETSTNLRYSYFGIMPTLSSNRPTNA